MLGQVASAIGEAGGIIGAVDLVEVAEDKLLRDITVDAADQEQWDAITRRDRRRRGRARGRHHRPHLPAARRRQDRAAQQAAAEDARRPLDGLHARASRASAWRSPRTATRPSSTRSSATRSPSSPTAPRCSASATSAREAAMPVMEGKAMLFKEFAGVDAFPICLDTKDPDEIVETVEPHRARLRRHQPRGHLRAALLRDRGPPEGSSSTSRSSTTTSTAPRSSSSPRCSTPASSPAASSTDLRVLVTGLGAAGRRGDEDPHGGRRARHRRRATRTGARVAPSAPTTPTAR